MKRKLLLAAFAAVMTTPVMADENLLGYVAGTETLPAGASEAYLWLTRRWDKGQGSYTATDAKLEYEYGLTHRLSGTLALMGQSIDTEGLVIDGYLPGREQYGMKPSGVEAKLKYNFLSAVKDGIGLSTHFELNYAWLDPHSGKDKKTGSAETGLQLQKNFLDDQLVLVGNAAVEATMADRAPLSAADQAAADAAIQAMSGDPAAAFEWPTDPEMEIEFKLGAGLSYRFAPNWFAGVETIYETEFETEVGQERWSWFAGPSIHYGGKSWWATLTWLPQIAGGKEKYIGQTQDMHLIEKTRQEVRLKLGYNF